MKAYRMQQHLEQAAKAHIGEHGMVHVVSLDQLESIPCKNESAEEGSSRVVITDKVITEYGHQLILRPRTYTMGIGCRRDTPKELILDAIQQSLAAHKLSPKSLVTAASVIVKQDEVGLLEAMEIMGWPIVFYTQDEMAPLIEEEKLKESNFVKGTIGVGNVCETTALLAAKSRTLIQHKTIYPKTTVAIAQVTSK